MKNLSLFIADGLNAVCYETADILPAREKDY